LMARLNIAHAAKAERQARMARSSSVGSLEARRVSDDFSGMTSPWRGLNDEAHGQAIKAARLLVGQFEPMPPDSGCRRL
jgi:hypothetical protein